MPLTRRELLRTTAAVGLAAVPLRASARAEDKMRPPNLVFIMTDNQGAWTLGCYGNRDIRTPHIDRLAREGTRFTRAYSVNAVCSPCRATFLTGLVPSQHGVHCWLGGGRVQMGPKAYCTIQEFRSLPEILAEAGYVCGLVGKWHLGANLHPQEGFTTWTTKPHGHTAAFYNVPIIQDGTVRNVRKYTTDFWTDHAVRFIERNKDKPFFLFLAYNGPYGLGPSLLRPARNRHAAYYADKNLPSFPRLPVHPWLHNNRQYINNVHAMRRYAAECSGIDDGVGQAMAALQRLGLDESTLVVYTADQGWGGGQHGIWGMGDHTRPLHAFDDTMHIPLLLRHPGSIPAGRAPSEMVSTYDWMPTLLSYLGLGARMPKAPPSPGRNFAPLLRGRAIPWNNVVYYEFENTRAIRTADWKLIRRCPAGPHELYDLKNDPGETANLIADPARAKTRRNLKARLDRFFARYANLRYDLWRGGRSKARRLTAPCRAGGESG